MNSRATTFRTNRCSKPAGQRQTADNIETMGIASYQHTFSSHAVADFRAMVRDNANDFNSNDEFDSHRGFPAQLVFAKDISKAPSTIDHGRNEWKFGVESDNTFLNENFSYHITDPTQFDPDTPPDFSFLANRPDLEQSAIRPGSDPPGKLDDQRGACAGTTINSC